MWIEKHKRNQWKTTTKKEFTTNSKRKVKEMNRKQRFKQNEEMIFYHVIKEEILAYIIALTICTHSINIQAQTFNFDLKRKIAFYLCDAAMLLYSFVFFFFDIYSSELYHLYFFHSYTI